MEYLINLSMSWTSINLNTSSLKPTDHINDLEDAWEMEET